MYLLAWEISKNEIFILKICYNWDKIFEKSFSSIRNRLLYSSWIYLYRKKGKQKLLFIVGKLCSLIENRIFNLVWLHDN